MTHTFRLVGIDPAPFEPLFALSDEQLKEHRAERRFANADSASPCRVSLQDAEQGDEMLLLPFVHQAAGSPYHSSGPIFVRKGAVKPTLAIGEVPPVVTSRLMSLRAYDAAHLITAASVCEGTQVAGELAQYFSNPAVVYVQLHNAKRGCFSCTAVRA